MNKSPVNNNDDNEFITKYLYKLTNLTLSTILFVRNFFNEDCYLAVEFGPVSLRLLKQGSNDAVDNLIKYIKNCYEPLQKRYLKTLIMEIHDSFNMIECYDFDFDYSINLNDIRIKFPRKNDINLILSLFHSMDQLDSIPKSQDYHVVFKILYQSHTPKEYEPNGFIPHDLNSPFNNEKSEIIDQIVIKENFFKIKIKRNPKISLNDGDSDDDGEKIEKSNRFKKLYH